MTEPVQIRTLDHQECWGLLRTAEVGRLAVLLDDGPDLIPVNYVVDHGSVVFRTAATSRAGDASVNHPVAFEVDGYDAATREAWSVVLRGEAEEVRDFYEWLEALDLPLYPWHNEPKPRFVRLAPGALTGRRFPVSDSTAWATPTTGARRAPDE